MQRDYSNKALWTKTLSDGTTLRDRLIRSGGPSFDADAYMDSYLGELKLRNYHTTLNYENDVMNPELLRYWETLGKGLKKEQYRADDPYYRWSVYTPLSAFGPEGKGKLYPCIFELHGGAKCGLELEDAGFIQLAAEKEIIVVTPENEGTDTLAEIYAFLTANYPVDRSRVYVSGFSYGGGMAFQNAIVNCRLFAAAHMAGTVHPGVESTTKEEVLTTQKGIDRKEANNNMMDRYFDLPKLVEEDRALGIALIHTAGTAEVRYPFPLCRDPWGPQGGFKAKDKIGGINMIRRLANISELTVEEAFDRTQNAANDSLRIIGLPMDKTWTTDIAGVRHFCGDVFDPEGVPVMRYIATENCPHNPSPTVPEMVWTYFEMFRRDLETGKLIYTGASNADKLSFFSGRQTGTQENRIWWETARLPNGKTPIEEATACGSSAFDAEGFCFGEFGDYQRHVLETVSRYSRTDDPSLADYWRRRGLIREYSLSDSLNGWTAFIPADAVPGEKFPAIVSITNGPDTWKRLENHGWPQLAAKERLIVLMPEDGFNEEHVREFVAMALRRWPIDPERVFISGHSAGGVAGSHQVIAHPEIFAGAAIFNTEYAGNEVTPEELEKGINLGIPYITVSGTREVQTILPYNADPDRPPINIRAIPHLEPSYHSSQRCLQSLNLWRKLNGCRLYSDAEDRGEMPTETERQIGARFDETEVRELHGARHYIGRALGSDGLPAVTVIAVEGLPHMVPATGAELSWEFLKAFRRDAETGKIVRRKPGKAWLSVKADTEYGVYGQMVIGFELMLNEGTQVDGLKPEDFSILAYTNRFPILRERSVMGIHRNYNNLYLMVEPFCLSGESDGYKPASGVDFSLRCYGREELSFTSADVTALPAQILGRYQSRWFAQDGLQAFGCACYVNPSERPLPVLVYSPGSHSAQFDGLKHIRSVNGQMFVSEAFQAEYPCHVFAPCFPLSGRPPKGEEGQAQLDAYAAAFTSALKAFITECGADRERVYFFGGGGGALFQLPAYDPELFAAAVMTTAIFDYHSDGVEIKYLEKLSTLPIFLCHGADDLPCPIRRSRLAYEKLLEFGNKNVFIREIGSARSTELGFDLTNPVAGHQSAFADIAEDRSVYRWLFSWRKQK